MWRASDHEPAWPVRSVIEVSPGCPTGPQVRSDLRPWWCRSSVPVGPSISIGAGIPSDTPFQGGVAAARSRAGVRLDAAAVSRGARVEPASSGEAAWGVAAADRQARVRGTQPGDRHDHQRGAAAWNRVRARCFAGGSEADAGDGSRAEAGSHRARRRCGRRGVGVGDLDGCASLGRIGKPLSQGSFSFCHSDATSGRKPGRSLRIATYLRAARPAGIVSASSRNPPQVCALRPFGGRFRA